MTINPEETPLFSINTGKQIKKRAPRQPKEAPTTPQGDKASDIIATWIDYVKAATGAPIPSTITKRMARQVKVLIQDGYHTAPIKQAMVVWLARWLNNPMTTPESLPNIIWHLTVTNSPAGASLRQELNRALQKFGPAVAHTTGDKKGLKKADRTNAQAAFEQKLAERAKGISR